MPIGSGDQALQASYDEVAHAIRVLIGANVDLSAGDIEIGAVELQDAAGVNRAAINASGELSTTNTGIGATGDAAVITNTTGSLSGKLRGLVAILADVWNSTAHALGTAVKDPTSGSAAKVTDQPAVDTDFGLVVRLPRRGTLTDRSGTITTGNTSQQLAAVNTGRRYLFVGNPRTATESLWINFTTDAVKDQPSIELGAGDSFVMEDLFVSTEKVTIIAATTGHKFVAKEG